MDDKNGEILFQILEKALERIRWVIFANLAISAIVFSNVYIENWTLDNELKTVRHQILMSTSSAIKEVKDCINSKDRPHCIAKIFFEPIKEHTATPLKLNSNVTEFIKKPKEVYLIDCIRNKEKCNTPELNNILNLYQNILQYSLESRTNRMKKNVELKSHLPVFGLTIPINDLNIICGILMAVFSIWLALSLHQIGQIFSDEKVGIYIKKIIPSVQHAFLMVYSKKHRGAGFMSGLMLFIPALMMITVLLNDAWDTFNVIKGFPEYLQYEPLLCSLAIRLTLLAGLALSLIWSWRYAISVSNQLIRDLHRINSLEENEETQQ